MSHPIPNTNESHSIQIILPQKQLGRKSDMYVFCCSYTHNVAQKGSSFVSTSYDATTHFETTVTDVLNLYTEITGKC
uniref:Uncharacterized protein n=1 Tax=Arundo donax TaxID=35708 RepID=A0A0A9G6D7_ARUDO